VLFADFGSTEELKTYLSSTYERVCTGEITSIDSTVQTLVTVALHYIKHSNAQVHAEVRKNFACI